MGLGLASRIDRLEKRRDPARRYVDIAVQFHVVELQGDEICWTDVASQVYGGRWDTKRLEYADEATDVLHLPATAIQFEYVESTARVTEISGGRGLGKSYSGLLVATKNVCNRPFIDGRVVSPTQELFLVQWDKYVPLMLETGWLLGGDDGVKEARHELWYVNGVVVQFRSGHKPGRLASWGGGWAICDESQDITDKAIGKLLYCLREGHGLWQLYHQLTPAPGEALIRHRDNVTTAASAPADAKVIHAESRANLFIDHDVFDYAARRMGKDQYGVEVLGSWEIVERMEEDGKPKPVFECLTSEWEQYERAQTDGDLLPHEWIANDFWQDVTRQVVATKAGAGIWNWIGGVDPGTSVPNECVVLKVFRRRGDKDARNHWVVWDVITGKGHCGHLGEQIVEAGYAAREMFIVPDFSAWGRSYVRQPNGSGKASSGLGPVAARLMQQHGFRVAVGRSNPHIKHSIDDVLEKLDPVVGQPRLLFRLPEAAPVFENMATVLWNPAGKDFDPAVPNDKTDAARYPISFFEPAARIARGGTRLIVGRGK